MVKNFSNVNKNTNIIVLPESSKFEKKAQKKTLSLEEAESELQKLEQAVPYNPSQYYNPFASSVSYVNPKQVDPHPFDIQETENLVHRLIEEEKTKLGIGASRKPTYSKSTLNELPGDKTLLDFIEPTPENVVEIARRKRGRPKGSKNVGVNPIGGLEPVSAIEPLVASSFKTSQFPIGVESKKKIKGQREDRNTDIAGKPLSDEARERNEL